MLSNNTINIDEISDNPTFEGEPYVITSKPHLFIRLKFRFKCRLSFYGRGQSQSLFSYFMDK
jgi:hypothetical protein